MMFCSKCLKPNLPLDERAIKQIRSEYLKDEKPWYVGYSGGKDSSAVLKLVFNALSEISSFHKPVTVIYCDTGVEIPTISKYVRRTIRNLKLESRQFGLPLKYVIAEPPIDDRFFVKVIGRGYPPPTNIFRWCTDRLRINPVARITGNNPDSVILLGVRKGESERRDRTIARYRTKNNYFLSTRGPHGSIFSPIIEHSTRDVWSTLQSYDNPKSIDHGQIGQLYKDAGAECPVVRESTGTACGKGRFGCWTCTVVREDRSVSSLIDNGYSELRDLYKFRNWLATVREDSRIRCNQRRNGTPGPGPITLEGRRLILSRLQSVETQSGHRILQRGELERIHELWALDEMDANYRES